MRAPVFLLIACVASCHVARAEDFTTSHGVRRLPMLVGIRTEAEAQPAARAGESLLAELLIDISSSDRARASLLTEVDGIAQKLKAEQAAVGKLREHFTDLDSKYKAAYAAFEQHQKDLDEEATRQRTEGAKLEALPSAQRDHSAVERINAWASEIGAKRAALVTERESLLQQYNEVEAERQVPEKAKAEAEARLGAIRETLQGRIATQRVHEAQLYGQLRQAAAYMRRVREVLLLKSGRPIEHSSALDEASERLQAFAARPHQ